VLFEAQQDVRLMLLKRGIVRSYVPPNKPCQRR
jgi:hypothetical protein